MGLVRDLGDNGIASSICTKQLERRDAPDFGYRPVVKALVERWSRHLGAPEAP